MSYLLTETRPKVMSAINVGYYFHL